MSPTSFSAYAEKLRDFDITAKEYLTLSAMSDEEQSCNEKCRKKLFCRLNYAVNEQSLICTDYDFSLTQAARYFAGAFQNPWYFNHKVWDDIDLF